MRKVLLVASTLDGYIAQARGQVSTEWTSPEDKKWFTTISKEIGTLIMGRETYETIGKPLPGRKIIVYTTQKEKVAGAEELDNFSPNSEKQLFVSGKMSLTELMGILEKKGLRQVAICGGARVYQQAMKEKQVNEIYLTLEPVMFGAGIKLLAEGENEGLWQQRWTVENRSALSSQTEVWHLLTSAA